MSGVCICFDVQSFRERFDSLVDIAYYKCFTDLLGFIAPMARDWNRRILMGLGPADPLVQPQFTFDRRQGEGTITETYDTFMGQPEWRGTEILHQRVSFDTRKNPRIQIADVVAREGMKELDRLITSRSPRPRGAKLALDAAGKFRFVNRDCAYIEHWRSRQAELEQAEGMTRDQYRSWLTQTNRVGHDGAPVDNVRNRMMHMTYLDNKASLLNG